MASASAQLLIDDVIEATTKSAMTSTWSNSETCEGSSEDSSPTASPPPELSSSDGEVVFVSKGRVFSPCELLGFRVSMHSDEADGSVRKMFCQAKLQPTTWDTAAPSTSKVVAPVRHQNMQLVTAWPSAGTWMSQQRRSASGSPRDADEKVARAARSILNKVTAETLNSMSEQLVQCGIERPEHISKVMSELFDKATQEHHFTPMYAEMCMKLEQAPHIAAVVEASGQKHSFRRLLLNQCQVVFEQLVEKVDVDDALSEDAAARRKEVALGNIKLIGHLIVNGMLASSFLVDCADELIRKHAKCSEALESLAALMMAAAPTFDTKEWQHLGRLLTCFVAMKKLTRDKALPARGRFLLRDVLDARDAGWPTGTKNPAIIHAETQLLKANIKKQQIAESMLATKPDIDSVAVAVPTSLATPNHKGEESSFDLKAFRRTLAAILGDLASDKNVSAAVQRVRMAQVPVECQAEQFSDLITRIVEEKRGPPRRCAMAFAAGLGAAEQSAFGREQCLAGLASFFQDVYPDLCNEVPRLPAIVRSELTPTFVSVFPRSEINSRLPPGVRF